jgi:hypothetical protein
LALGVLLKRYKPDIYNEVWANNNTDYQSLYYVVKKFAYYPFEKNGIFKEKNKKKTNLKIFKQIKVSI